MPNNSNIVLAAEQARELLEDERRIIVIPSKTIPQGMAAAFAFQEDESAETNREQMLEAISRVQSGQVTHAVRDTQYDELDIKAGNYIGIYNPKLLRQMRACFMRVKVCLDRCWRAEMKS